MSQRPPDPIPFPRDRVQPRNLAADLRLPLSSNNRQGPVIYSASGQPMRRVQPAPASPPACTDSDSGDPTAEPTRGFARFR